MENKYFIVRTMEILESDFGPILDSFYIVRAESIYDALNIIKNVQPTARIDGIKEVNLDPNTYMTITTSET